jgi:hypothetical protein
MRRHMTLMAVTAVLVTLIALPSSAGLIGLAVGAYGGMNTSLKEDGSNGSVLGAKVRVLTPIPIIGVEGWYARFGYDGPGEAVAAGDFSLAADGDGFNLWGIDALVGAVGNPGLRFYGVVGVNAAEFEEFGKDERTRKLGGELGAAMEFTPPVLGLGVEVRGSVMFPDISGDYDENFLTATVGLNYYF